MFKQLSFSTEVKRKILADVISMLNPYHFSSLRAEGHFPYLTDKILV